MASRRAGDQARPLQKRHRNASDQRPNNNAVKHQRVDAAPVKSTTFRQLPKVGSLVYSEEYINFGRNWARNVFMVTSHEVDATGPLAVAQKMSVMGVPYKERHQFNFSTPPGVAVTLVPQGLLRNGQRVRLRRAPHNPGFEPSRYDGYSFSKENYIGPFDNVLYGKPIKHFIRFSNNNSAGEAMQDRYDALRVRAASRTIRAYRNKKRRAMQDPLVKAALASPHQVYVDAHGRTTPGKPFKVPRGVCLVFLTAPGAAFWKDRDPKTISEKDAKRMILGVDGSRYSAPYFEGDEVQDYILSFGVNRSAIKVIGRSGNTFFSWKAIPEAEISGARTAETSNLNVSDRFLSDLVAILSSFGTRDRPVVLLLGICRPSFHPNLNHTRNKTARERIGERGGQGGVALKQQAEKPFLYNSYKRDARLKMLVDNMRNAGFVSNAFFRQA